MTPLAALGLLAALVAVATVAGLLQRRLSGRVRGSSRAGRITPADLATSHPFGPSATLVQLSTPFCAQCPGTARLLRELAGARDGVRHVEVDVAAHPDVADRFSVLQTPTTLLLDRDGRLVARVGGAPDRAALEQRLDTVLGGPRAR